MTAAELLVTGDVTDEVTRPSRPSIQIGEHLLESDLEEGEALPSAWQPLAVNTPERRAHGGSYDATWRQERFPQLPKDFDPRFYNAAPAALKLPASFPAGAPVRITGLSLEAAETLVPAQALLATFGFRGDEVESKTLVLDTLLIDATSQTIEWVWRASCSLQGRSYSLRSCRLHAAEAETGAKAP